MNYPIIKRSILTEVTLRGYERYDAGQTRAYFTQLHDTFCILYSS